MTEPDTSALVAELEALAARDPRAFRRRTARAVVRASLALAVVVPGIVFSLPFVLWAVTDSRALAWYATSGALLALAGGVVHLVTVVRGRPAEQPAGVEVFPAAAPRLFAEIEAMRKATGAPPIDRVLITADYNAFAAHVARPGRWRRDRVLGIGLPVLYGLSARQARAVLAHELAHLAALRVTLRRWLDALHRAYARLAGYDADAQPLGDPHSRKRAGRTAARLGAHALVLTRQSAYAADRVAARLATLREHAGALCAMAVQWRYARREYVSALIARADAEADVPADHFEALLGSLRPALALPTAAGYLSEELRHQDRWSAHPCLADRLTAVGAPASLAVVPEAGAGSAADHYLGPSAVRIASELEPSIREALAREWAERHESARQAREKLAALPEQRAPEGAARSAITTVVAGTPSVAPAAPEVLDAIPMEDWTRVRLHVEAGDEQAQPLLRAFVARHPDHAHARFALGQFLLQRGNDEGVEHLEVAMRLEEDAALAMGDRLAEYLAERGRAAEARRFARRAWRRREVVQRALHERQPGGYAEAEYLAPALPDEALARVREELAQHANVRSAWLARRVVRWVPERPAHVLLVRRSGLAALAPPSSREGWAIAVGAALGDGSDVAVVSPSPLDTSAKRALRRMRAAGAVDLIGGGSV